MYKLFFGGKPVFVLSPVSHRGIFKTLDEDPSLLSDAVLGRRPFFVQFPQSADEGAEGCIHLLYLIKPSTLPSLP